MGARLLGALAVLLLIPVLSGLWPGQPSVAIEQPRSLRASFGGADVGGFAGSVELVGARVEPGEARPGAPVTLTLYWRAIAPLAGDYKVFVHLVDAERRKVAQEDALPVSGAGRTSAWWPGEVVEDRHELRLPGDAPPGEYRFEVGLYSARTGKRLEVGALDPSAPAAVLDGSAVMAGTLRVR